MQQGLLASPGRRCGRSNCVSLAECCLEERSAYSWQRCVSFSLTAYSPLSQIIFYFSHAVQFPKAPGSHCLGDSGVRRLLTFSASSSYDIKRRRSLACDFPHGKRKDDRDGRDGRPGYLLLRSGVIRAGRQRCRCQQVAVTSRRSHKTFRCLTQDEEVTRMCKQQCSLINSVLNDFQMLSFTSVYVLQSLSLCLIQCLRETHKPHASRPPAPITLTNALDV